MVLKYQKISLIMCHTNEKADYEKNNIVSSNFNMGYIIAGMWK